MKFKKLLVLSALWLTASGAMAAIVDGVRQKPVPSATQGFVASESTETYYYLYNVDAKGFFTEGNSWGTQVSIGSTGLKVAFIVDSDYDGAYLFNDFSNAKNSWKLTFFDNEGAMFVDLGSQANYRWGVEENGETFRLYAASDENGNPGWDATTDEETGEEIEHPAYREGQYMGWDSSSSSTACVPYLTEGEGHCINWAFVTEEVYNVYADEIAVYNAAEKLRAALDDVKAKGFTATAEYDAVYANESATKDDLEKAQADLNDAFVEWGKNNASVENPADMTSMIVNPHFDNGDATTGWSGTAFGRGGTVSDGGEHYNKTFDTYQTITGLAPGVYAIGVNGYYRAGDFGPAVEHWLANDATSKAAKLYGKVGDVYYETPIANVMSGAQAEAQGVGDVEVTYQDGDGNDVIVYAPNTMAAGDYFFHTLKQYANKLLVAVDESGELTIGVKKSEATGNDWTMFDDFSLTFYGTGADAAKLYLDETLKNYSDYTPEEGVIYTKSYLDAYKAAYSGEKTAANMTEATAIINGISEAYNALQKNMELWADLRTAVEKGKAMSIDPKYDALLTVGDLADYCNDDYEPIEAAAKLTNEQLEAEIEKVNQMINDVINESKADVHDGKDMTDYIVNPGFDDDKDINFNGAEGWNIERINGNNSTGYNIVRGPLGQGNKDLMEQALGKMNYCFEAWHGWEWDVWQEIEDLPVGMYELEIQGYVRCEVGGYNRGDDIEPDYPSPVYLYMNNAKSQFPSVYSETRPINPDTGEEYEYTTVESWTTEDVNGYLYPNSMGGAAQCFGWGMYKTTAYGLIAKGGDKFRIGVKMNANQDWWCIFDNFKLTYKTPTVEVVKPILDEELAKIDLSKPMGSNIYGSAEELKTKAAAAEDGTKMFSVLADVYDLSASIQESIALFEKMNKLGEELQEAIDNSEADAATKTAANDLRDKIYNGFVEKSALTDEEAQALIDAIPDMLVKLALPAGMADASDENPVECTGVIKSPSFENDEMESTSEGWTNPGNLGNDDEQRSALAIEFWQSAFDMYQTINGLPAGTYKMTVNAWVRLGGNEETYKAWNEDPNATMAYAYAVDGDSTVYAAPVANLMKAGDNLSGSTEFAPNEEVVYYMPNTLVEGHDVIDQNEGLFTTEVICKVLEDGVLTIGIKKAEEKTNSWVVIDDFRLFYLGTNSSLTPSGDGTGINNAEFAAKKVEFFSIGGARVSKPGKGVAIMKTTGANGDVKYQKVMIK